MDVPWGDRRRAARGMEEVIKVSPVFLVHMNEVVE